MHRELLKALFYAEWWCWLRLSDICLHMAFLAAESMMKRSEHPAARRLLEAARRERRM